jgi:superfamily I DNA/RNA helicase
MESKMTWSNFQEAIFTAVLSILRVGRDLVVLARAGTGKTSTMVEAVIRFCRANPRAKVLTCAFNVKNARELDARLRDAGLDWKAASAKTLNSVGLATCKKAWGKGVAVDGRKGRTIAKAVAEEYERTAEEDEVPSGLAGKVAKLATMAKITLTDPRNAAAMVTLCNRFAIADEQEEVGILVRLAGEAMERAKADRMVVDFDDQLWFPHVFRLQPWKHDLVIVDECQDMNASQLELARKSVRGGGRLIAVGDDRQAIYGWRGADSGFMGRMVKELNAITLPLPRTYRCGKAIVREAREIVPDYEGAESTVEGVVRTILVSKIVDEVRAGDFVISRANAPLLPICLDLLKRKVPATIQGRDIMGQLMGIVERSGCESTDCLLRYLDEYEVDERVKLEKADADDDVIEALSDRVACLRVLAPEHALCSDLLAHLDEVFTDRDDASKVTLSSAHRSKGLERDRVFMIADTFRRGDQEDNCRYVAITRARSELVYATGSVR